ncbi:myo-inosose-2 dehydratase [Sesbania bispinosa]|nr:myo-inosose-2 dehydratase [Sesbania bispinosa]
MDTGSKVTKPNPNALNVTEKLATKDLHGDWITVALLSGPRDSSKLVIKAGEKKGKEVTTHNKLSFGIQTTMEVEVVAPNHLCFRDVEEDPPDALQGMENSINHDAMQEVRKCISHSTQVGGDRKGQDTHPVDPRDTSMNTD